MDEAAILAMVTTEELVAELARRTNGYVLVRLVPSRETGKPDVVDIAFSGGSVQALGLCTVGHNALLAASLRRN